MADRTSAEVFATVFAEALAILPAGEERTAFVRRMWGASHQYDFHPCQMDADDELVALGLAKRVPDGRYPDEEEIVYADSSGIL